MFFWVEGTLKHERQGKETSGKRDKQEYDLLHHQAVLHILPILPLRRHLLLIIIIIILLLILVPLLLLKEVSKTSRPSLLSCRDL